ncbi:cyclic nucleotide-binding domain-containing protein [Aurantimonas marina]|uniref:helix-turn-helix domain-containing protein n=1 Tax=Aurantimonas marina TaxID=2780508 RepID=UPI0019D2B4DD|nr:helix-turn-helix domain-containing protein [Aurantimonas marina]
MPCGILPSSQTTVSCVRCRRLLPWLYIFNLQTAQTTLSNAGYNVEARLTRWLLMCHDRIDGDRIPLTHEFLGIMLAVRRSPAPVTNA